MMISRFIRATALLVFASALGCSAKSPLQPGDLVIANGSVIDGTGSAARNADVLIRGNRIWAVRELGDSFPDTVTVIPAEGFIVSPGFIDTHAHGDPAKTPEMENFLAMGVTTIVLGQDGSSTRVGALAEWFDSVAAAKPGPNVATYLGHGTLRHEAGVGLSSAPTEEEITQIANLVEQGLQLGALGLTTGLEYQPGSFSQRNELAAIAAPVGARGLTVMSHVRNEDDDQLIASIRELVEQCRSAGANAHVSHIKSVYGKGASRAEEILAVLQEARDSGVGVTADIYPYTASYTGIGLLFPDYSLPPNDYQTVAQQQRDTLLEYLDRRVAKRNGPQATLFGTGEYAGKTLAQVSEETGKPYAEVLLEYGPTGGSAAYFIMDEELQARLLVDPHVNICSDGSPGMRHPRGYGSFARIIRKFVLEDNLITLEEGIHKMSGLPAQTTGLNELGRGTLVPGNYADLLIFNPNEVVDRATFSDPFQLAEGMHTIIVNGNIVRANNIFTGTTAGTVIRRNDSTSGENQ